MNDDDLLERVLGSARQALLSGGSPAWLVLAALPDGTFRPGPLVVTRMDQAEGQARALAEAFPGASVFFVGCDRGGTQSRFTICDRDGVRLLRRDEVQEATLNDRRNEVI